VVSVFRVSIDIGSWGEARKTNHQGQSDVAGRLLADDTTDGYPAIIGLDQKACSAVPERAAGGY
jgi:hypothetical protein